jgi:mannose-6-phosphate isomerase-like protein (cupin superfamily)
VEVFVALTGRWALPYATAPDGEVREVVLGSWDVCSVPAGVWRGFRNAGEERAYLLVVVGGTDAGRLTWAPDVLERAAAAGQRLDADGYRAER